MGGTNYLRYPKNNNFLQISQWGCVNIGTPLFAVSVVSARYHCLKVL